MKKNNHRESLILALILLIVLAAAIFLDAKLPSYHIAIKVIKKACVYSLVAVSMNLLNGFTGLFSLGQAGFMLLGAFPAFSANRSARSPACSSRCSSAA